MKRDEIIKTIWLKAVPVLILTAMLSACGGEEKNYRFDNPYDERYNGQPDTSGIAVSSLSKKTGVEINPVTLNWSGADPDGSIAGYYYRFDDDPCSFFNNDCPWTTDPFVVYSSFVTGTHAIEVAATDNLGAVDRTPLSRTFAVDATPPAVSFTLPRRNAVDVPVNTIITAVFNEPVDPAGVTDISFTLNGASGTVVYLGVTASYRPSGNLAPDTLYTAMVKRTITDEAGNAMTADYQWTFRTSATGATDATPPSVSHTYPARGAADVSPESFLSIVFSEPIDPLSVTGSVSLSNGQLGVIEVSGMTLLFKPYTTLDCNAGCTATVTTAVKDLAGNSLGGSYSWSFATWAAPPASDPGNEGPETTPPAVSFTSPGSSVTGVSPNITPAVTFSEPMDPATVTVDTLHLQTAAGTSVTGSVYYSGLTAQFVPYTTLTYSTSYVATVMAGAKDLAGNPMSSAYSWSFITGSLPDAIPPAVSAVTPAGGSTGIPSRPALTATFSEPLDPYSVTPETFTLMNNASAQKVPGAVYYSGFTVTFMPHTTLAYSTNYTASLSKGIRDLAGNPLTAVHQWNFTTGDAPDLTRPAVMWVTPEDGMGNVNVGLVLTATFSEPVDAQSVSSATFTLRNGGGTAVAGNVSYNGTTATFVPLAPLAEGMTYTATLSTAIRDYAGNRLMASHAWSFTTGYIPDTTPPTVVWHHPAAGATGVFYDSAILVEFSEPVDPSTINGDTFVLTEDGPPPVGIRGNIYYDGEATAVFRPLTSLNPLVWHTVTIKSGAGGLKDLAGNPMASDKVWTFKTSDLPDTVPPSIVFTNPTTSETNVGVKDPRIFIAFDEPLDGSSVNSSTITLTDSYGAVSGGVYFDGVLTALFKPVGDLAYKMNYTVTVKTGPGGIRDLAGNEMAGPTSYIWHFTTGDLPISIANSISGGYYHSLSIKKDLTAWAWGDNTDGQLGTGNNTSRNYPVRVSGLTGVKALSAGEYHSLALLDDGTVWAWGDNLSGQLGDNTVLNPLDPATEFFPVQVFGLSDIKAIASGKAHSMALKEDGTVWAWGDNDDGQLGNGVDSGDLSAPVQVQGLLAGESVKAIAAGDFHSLAITADGRVFAWGENAFGQLGVSDSIAMSRSPVQVDGLGPSLGKAAVAIAGGYRHSLAVTSDGKVWAFGMNFFGQLGQGTSDSDPHPTPMQIGGLSNIKIVSAGTYHSAALGQDTTVFAWGLNEDGQLGNGASGWGVKSLSPVQVKAANGIDNLLDIVALESGSYHNIALDSGGTVYTWGYNGEGELGDCSNTLSAVPVPVVWSGCP